MGWETTAVLRCQKINVSYSFKKLRVTCQRLQLMVCHDSNRKKIVSRWYVLVLLLHFFLNSNLGINVCSQIQIVHKIGFAVLTKMSSN